MRFERTALGAPKPASTLKRPLAVIRVAIPGTPSFRLASDARRSLQDVASYFDEVAGPRLIIQPTLSGVVSPPLPPPDPKSDHYSQYRALLQDAIRLACQAKFKFDLFVDKATGEVDGLVLSHTAVDDYGTLQSLRLLSHQGEFDPPFEHNGYKFRRYVAFSERSTLGTLCHEFGHFFWNWEDLYDSSDPLALSTAGVGISYGLGGWCLMATGVGCAPPAPSAYIMSQSSAWPQAVDAKPGTLTIQAIQGGGHAVRLRHDAKSDEYFLAEIRCRSGRDRVVPGSGILLYRANDDRKHASNANPFAAQVRLVQGDGLYDLEMGDNEGDPSDAVTDWAGELVGTNAFHDSVLQDGTATGIALSDFKYDEVKGEGTLKFGVQAPRARGVFAETADDADLRFTTADADQYQGNVDYSIWGRYRFAGDKHDSLIAYGPQTALSFLRARNGTIEETRYGEFEWMSKHGSLHMGRLREGCKDPNILAFDPQFTKVTVYSVGTCVAKAFELDASVEGTIASACLGRFGGGTNYDDLLLYSPFRQRVLLYRTDGTGKFEQYAEGTLKRKDTSFQRWRSVVTLRTPARPHDHIALHDYAQSTLDVWTVQPACGSVEFAAAIDEFPQSEGMVKAITCGRFMQSGAHDAIAAWDAVGHTVRFYAVDLVARRLRLVREHPMAEPWAGIVPGDFGGKGQDGLYFHAR